jgi:hypothetical protein
MKVLVTILAVIVGLSIGLGISALIARLLSLGIAFVFDYHIGFLKTWVALFVIQVISRVVFSGMQRKEAN